MIWIAHKFGGRSLADAEGLARVAELLAGSDDEAQVVVVSAMTGVTDQLIELTRLAAANDRAWPEKLETLRRQHLDTATTLVGSQHPVNERRTSLCRQLQQLISGLALLGSAPIESLELISGLGEVYAAELMTACLDSNGDEAVCIDDREVLRV